MTGRRNHLGEILHSIICEVTADDPGAYVEGFIAGVATFIEAEVPLGRVAEKLLERALALSPNID
jgi:hypothetical protein